MSIVHNRPDQMDIDLREIAEHWKDEVASQIWRRALGDGPTGLQVIARAAAIVGQINDQLAPSFSVRTQEKDVWRGGAIPIAISTRGNSDTYDYACSRCGVRVHTLGHGDLCVLCYGEEKAIEDEYRVMKREGFFKKSALGESPRRMGRRARITEEQIMALSRAQGARCLYCGELLDVGFHVDHFIPVSLGGGEGLANLALSCPACNLSKHVRLPWDWDGWSGQFPAFWEAA